MNTKHDQSRHDIDEPDNILDGATPEALAEPDEHTFWHLYSPRFEMPISYTLSALAIVGFICVIGLIFYLDAASSKDKPGAKIGLVGGEDDFGEGSEGAAGGVAEPITLGANNTPTPEDVKNILPNPDLTLPQVKEDISKQLQLEDPNSSIPIANQNVAPLASLDESIRKKLLGIGQTKGKSNADGEGENEKGGGKGGTGSDSTRQRSLRWVISFKTAGGRDYLDQLHAQGAVIFIPMPGDGKKFMYFSNLATPVPGTFATDSDWTRHLSQMQFHDFSKQSCTEVSEALGLNFTAKSFIAFFPKKFEDDLAKKETGFQQRRSADIDETKFQVVRRGGNYEIFVSGQTLKK